jgi:hypothetical protein
VRTAAPGAGGGTVEVTPATLDVTGLAPGAAAERAVTVANGSDVPVVVTVTSTREGALFGGPAPLGLVATWSTDGPACDGRPTVDPGTTAELALRVELPAEAGNTYQGLTGTAVVTVTATELPGGACTDPGGVDAPGHAGPGRPDPGPGAGGPTGAGPGAAGVQAAPPAGDDLALTGTQAGSLLVAVVVLLAGGCALLRRRGGGASATVPREVAA